MKPRAPAFVPTALWLGVMVAVVVVWWLTYGAFQLGTYQDDAKYVLLARALAAGERYAIHLGPAPAMTSNYPFVFPLILVPFVTWWPDAFARMTVISLVATLANVTMLYWGWSLLAGNASRWWALAASALYGLAPLTLGHAGMVMSEAVFSTFAWATLLIAESIAPRRATLPSVGNAETNSGLYIALGFFCALTAFTRVVGLAIVGAACLRALTASGVTWRRVVALLGGVLLLVSPALSLSSLSPRDLMPDRYMRTVNAPATRGYAVAENDVATRLARGLREYAGEKLRAALVPIGGGAGEQRRWNDLGFRDLTPLTSVAVALLVVVGIVAAPPAGRVRPAVLWSELVMFAVLCLWPFRATRFLYPLLPFLFFQLLQGLHASARGVTAMLGRGRSTRIADALVVGAVVSLVTLLPYRFVAQATIPSTHYAPDYWTATAWIREQAPGDAVVLAEEWAATAVYGGRAVVATFGLETPEQLMRAVRQYGVNYVLVTPARVWRQDGQRQYSRYALRVYLPFLRGLQERGALQLVYESDAPDRVRVYRLDATRLPQPANPE